MVTGQCPNVWGGVLPTKWKPGNWHKALSNEVTWQCSNLPRWHKHCEKEGMQALKKPHPSAPPPLWAQHNLLLNNVICLQSVPAERGRAMALCNHWVVTMVENCCDQSDLCKGQHLVYCTVQYLRSSVTTLQLQCNQTLPLSAKVWLPRLVNPLTLFYITLRFISCAHWSLWC